MSRHFIINMTNPCSEEWLNMTQGEKGRFCNSCQKHVIDFTTMSDEQLIAFFKNDRSLKSSSMCGRFNDDQLNRQMKIPRQRIPWVKYFLQLAIPAFIASIKVSAQVRTGKNINNAVAAYDRVNLDKRSGEPQSNLTGRVVDESGGGVAYASVMVKGTTFGTATDSTGFFSFHYPMPQKDLVLVASSVGFEDKAVKIDLSSKKQDILIPLISSNVLEAVVVKAPVGVYKLGGAVGGIAITRFNSKEEKTHKPLASSKLFQVFPNPAKPNSLLKINVPESAEGALVLQMVSSAGQLVITKNVAVSKHSQLLEFTVPTVAAGIYFIKIFDTASGKIETKKLIIE